MTKEEKTRYDKKYRFDKIKYERGMFTMTENLAAFTDNLSVETSPEGIPCLASFRNSNPCHNIYRRFGKLFARSLSQLEVDIWEIEQELDELDKLDAQDSAQCYRLFGNKGYNAGTLANKFFWIN